jgi:site-specific recombinase XerD
MMRREYSLYATGVRNAELTHLKVSDIDGKRMAIHIQGGKGRRDPRCGVSDLRVAPQSES